MISSIKNYLSENTALLIRMDDIAENMNWSLMKKCEDLFDELNIKPLLGVIPKNEDSELLKYDKSEYFWQEVRNWSKKGWEISMHGYNHVYGTKTYKKDYFNYGGGSEFFGLSLSDQKIKIKNGLKKFVNEGIKIRSFFAPNHTYDLNTFKALDECGIINIIDGYGVFPYSYKNLNFIPQLFYKEIMLPFGIQSTQIHLNYWKEKDFSNFEKFLRRHQKKIVSFDNILNKVKSGFFIHSINFALKNCIKISRTLKF